MLRFLQQDFASDSFVGRIIFQVWEARSGGRSNSRARANHRRNTILGQMAGGRTAVNGRAAFSVTVDGTRPLATELWRGKYRRAACPTAISASSQPAWDFPKGRYGWRTAR